MQPQQVQPQHSGQPNQTPQPAHVSSGGNNSKPDKPKKERKPKKWLKWLLLLLVIAAIGVFGYLYYDARQEIQRLSDPQAAAEEETKRLTEKVGELIELPADETPTIATVIDKERLNDQPFFARAENQDRVLIYTQARKAILYRPSTNKIIEVAPINIGNNQQGQATDGGEQTESTEQ